MEFQIKIRLFDWSATKSLVPSLWTPTGRFRLFADVRFILLPEVILGCPRTRLAACWFVVGTEFQIKTRWLLVSATDSRVPSLYKLKGEYRLCAVSPP